jgi:tRNA-modifying protein YgfZ
MTSIAFLPHRCLIRVSGDEAPAFLNGLLTLNTEAVVAASPACHYGAFLRPQGKLFADIIAHKGPDGALRLDVNRDAAPEVLAKLKMYRLRAKIEIEALDAPVFVSFGGPLAEGFIPDARSDVIGDTFGFAYEAHEANAGEDDWRIWRTARGLSDPGHDFAADTLYAIEANLDLLGGIDFRKGCYIGQELTSRMKRRGPVKNRLLPFAYANQPPEESGEILNGDMRAGRVITAEEGRGLALMRLDRSAGDLKDSFGQITLALPVWLATQIELAAPDAAQDTV